MSWWDIYWGESWINIKMMLADAPKYHPPREENEEENGHIEEMTDDDLIAWVEKVKKNG